MKIQKNWIYTLGIVMLGLLLFLPSTQVHLFDWDEINFAEAAREMIVTGDYFTVTIDYLPFWEKPPLFIWMQVLSMKVFGVTDFAARFPNVICGIATLLALFHIGKRVYNLEFARIWVLAYIGSLLPQFYFMSGIIDPVFNLFIFLALYGTFEFQTRQKAKYLLFAALFAGLALLTKGPVSLFLLFTIVFVHALVTGGNGVIKAIFTTRFGWLAIGVFVGVCSVYYGAEFILHGPKFFTEFVDYHIRLLATSEAGHAQPFYYHFFVLLIGCLPTSIFMLGGFSRLKNDESQQVNFTKLMAVMFFVVLIVFSVVKTKIIHYSSLCYFPLTFLAARYIYNVAYRKLRPKLNMHIAMLTLAGLFSLLLIVLPTIMTHVQTIIPLIKDPFAVGNLEAAVNWTWLDGFGGLVYFLSLVIFVYLSSKKGLVAAYAVLLIGTTIGINLSIRSLVPQVELITQNAAIQFYKSLEGEDCYIEVLDYKSYAHLYYAKKPKQTEVDRKDRKALLEGPIDKPAYFVVKNVNAKKYRQHPNLTEMYEQNGFVFFKREPGKSPAMK